MIEGSGSVPLTKESVSGSGRPKDFRILRIQIQNTGLRRLEQGLAGYRIQLRGEGREEEEEEDNNIGLSILEQGPLTGYRTDQRRREG